MNVMVRKSVNESETVKGCKTFCPNPSKYEVKLYRHLKQLGIACEIQYGDGLSHAFIVIPSAKLRIKIAAEYQEKDDYRKAEGTGMEDYIDFKGVETFGIGTDTINKEVSEVAIWIGKLARARSSRIVD